MRPVVPSSSVLPSTSNNNGSAPLSSSNRLDDSSVADAPAASNAGVVDAIEVPAYPPQPGAPLTSLAASGHRQGASLHQKIARVKDQRDAKAKRNEWRITKMVLAIFLSFVACYLPITITKVLDQDVRFPALHILAYIMLYLSSCINPIIYVIMNKQYRQAYKTVILCKPSRLLGLTHAGSTVGGK